MIFPKLGNEYYDEKDRYILSRMEKFYSQAITINQSYWEQADIDSRMESGDQDVWNSIYNNIPAYRKRQFNFNRIRRVINMVSGKQRDDRKSIVVIPVENSAQQTADQFTEIIDNINRQENVLNTVSNAFHGALVTGLNLLEVWIDYRKDPISGEIKVNNCAYNEFLIDPFFKKPDLSDCNGIWKRSYLTKKTVLTLIPDKQDEIMSMSPSKNNSDGKFQYMPESYGNGMQDLLIYDEYYYRDYRDQKMLIDVETGEAMEWNSDDSEALDDFLNTYPQITVLKQKIPTVRLAIVVEGRVMYDGPQPTGLDTYPFVPVFGYYNPQLTYYPDRIQGMVRGLRDAQYLFNHRKNTEFDILESQVNSGFIYKENALINPKDVFMSGQGRGIALKETAQMTDVQKIASPEVPQSMIELSNIMAREVMEISGVNEELLGSAQDDKAGILSMLRQGAGLVTLRGLFDNLDLSQKLLGQLFIDLIQKNYTPGKIQRITKDQPTEEFYSKNFGKYDAAVADGFNTTTQRQMQFAQLLHLKEVGVPIPSTSLIEAATLQNKTKLMEHIQQEEQQQQQAQQQEQQAQVQEMEAKSKLLESQAAADTSFAEERMSRIPENQAKAEERYASIQQKEAQAVQNEQDAILARAKALKELESIDLDQLNTLIKLAKTLSEEKTDLMEARSDRRRSIGDMASDIMNQDNQQMDNPDVGGISVIEDFNNSQE